MNPIVESQSSNSKFTRSKAVGRNFSQNWANLSSKEACLSCWDLPHHNTPVTLLVHLESPPWVWVHQGGFIMFRFPLQELIKLRILEKLGHSLDIVENCSMSIIFMQVILYFVNLKCWRNRILNNLCHWKLNKKSTNILEFTFELMTKVTLMMGANLTYVWT